ncbi:hypothetical protein Q5752_005883 [Cryptotrichosporon argae]
MSSFWRSLFRDVTRGSSRRRSRPRAKAGHSSTLCTHPVSQDKASQPRLCCDIDGVLVDRTERTPKGKRIWGVPEAGASFRELAQSFRIDIVSARKDGPEHRRHTIDDLSAIGIDQEDYSSLCLTWPKGKTSFILGDKRHCARCNRYVAGPGTPAWVFIDDKVQMTNKCRATSEHTMAILFGASEDDKARAVPGTYFAADWREVLALTYRLLEPKQ